MLIQAKHTKGFDSKLESTRYSVLRSQLRAGIIRDLKTQVEYPLFVNGQHVCTYIADFVYYKKGKLVVEDVKGFTTAVFRLKRVLFRAIHGVDIHIV